MIRHLAVLFVLACAVATSAQNSPPHQHGASTIIDGAVSPNLIPDSVAYRLYLYAVSTGRSPAQVDQQSQHAHLMRTGLSEADRQVFVGILSDFRTQYDALEAAYNALAS
jgi:hypothetical protein